MAGLSLADVSLLAAGRRYRKTIGTLSRWRSSPEPLALSSRGFHDTQALVRLAVEQL
jgi:hypothetical protein